ncbi:hypothetical protein PMZ80_002934 [Knufia obscura]|nr:hypothetical protein PMZ80_002934 [Knufia obscura]
MGSLASRDYHYRPVYVGLCALAPAIGAIAAAPFQRASYFSRSRLAASRTDSLTVTRKFSWSSHFVRRLLFMILLPICAGAYAGSSLGPPLLVAVPCIMAGFVGFFTTMATAECYSLIMETFDTTDLQPGMTGRPLRGSVDVQTADQRTNFSCYPHVSAGFAITHAISYILAACATAVCGRVERREGTVWATTGVAVISMALTLLLTLVVVKWKKVQMVPDGLTDFEHVRRASTSWRPVNVGRNKGKFRRLSILEMGRLTRFSEIRQRNRVEASLSGGLRSEG